MKLYSSNEYYKLYQGNMLDMLEVIKPESIDSIVTDPPYGLTSITKRFGKQDSVECQYGKDGSFQRLSKGFMGKEWDGSGIEYNIDTWKKCYEVLKPGGYLLAFGGSRTFHRIAVAIEDAGFEIRDTIMWLYGSGFPKSMDISKQIDKRGGNNTSFLCNLIKEKREEKKLSQKHLDELMGTSGMVNWWEKGERGITPIQFNKLCEILELPFKNIEEAKREVIGKKEKIESYEYKNNNVYQTNGDKEKITLDITIPSTDLAKRWSGWGTALKPSYEPIIVARKPFKGSLVDNVIEYGVGGINIDECRVDFNGNIPKASGLGRKKENHTSYFRPSLEEKWKNNDLGRFPANTILTYDDTDFDEVCGGFPYTKGDNRTSKPTYDKSIWGNAKSVESACLYADSGSASRYFYCAKASKKDRDEGLDEFEDKKFYSTLNTKNGSGERLDGGTTPIRKNTHPTVKPTELMQYLIRLVTPNKGIILDPFNGSGSTGKAVMYENKERNKNYKYIGIELTDEYLPIAKARIEYAIDSNIKVENEKKEDAPEGQLTIFDFKEML